MDKVRHMTEEQSAFVESLTHQFNIALLEIPNATMNELGAATRRRAGKIVPLQQECPITSRAGIDCYSQTRRATPNDDHVPNNGRIGGGLDHSVPVHFAGRRLE